MNRAFRRHYRGPGLLVLAAILVLTGCRGASYGTPANPLRFGYVPHERTQIILFRAADVTERIEGESGLVVEPFATMDYLGLVEAMCNREVEVTVLAASAYLLAAELGCRCDVDLDVGRLIRERVAGDWPIGAVRIRVPGSDREVD